MCGIAAAVGVDAAELALAVERMCAQMLPRGPDDGGTDVFGSERSTVVLGSRRLAIIDPSPAGHQPMHDAERGTAIVYNGMLYNFRELRAQLESEGERFRSDCDTEVALRAYERHGPECVASLRGMFAFAIWDGAREQLFLARDRLGIKPLYFSEQHGSFLCASSVKALIASGAVRPTLSQAGIANFLATGAVSEPLTAIEGVRALPAGHCGTLRAGTFRSWRYWSPPEHWRTMGRSKALAELRSLLEDSVRRHLVSDAPLGVFLSGGLDSSLLAALATREQADVRTVSLDFEDDDLSEQRYALAVAEQLGTRHITMTLTAGQLQEWLDDAFSAMDQPSFDGINTYSVSRAASEAGLKVALSGLGADELFDGYGYVRRIRLLTRARSFPRPLRELAASAAALPFGRSRAEKAREWLTGKDERCSAYELLRRLFADGEVASLVREEKGVKGTNGAARARPASRRAEAEIGRRVLILDIENYLRNVLLRDTDAMGMANSLEVRVPYIDDPLVEWASCAPLEVKGERKDLLRELARGVVPQVVAARSKRGFALPLARWIRSELRAEVGGRLCEPPSSVSALLSPHALAATWENYLSGRSHWLRPWALYALCRWVETMETPMLRASA